MEMHHKLRRDPTWHRDACNLCGQLGHRAADCSSGSVNWKQIYGDEEFVLRPPVYPSQIYAAAEEARKKKQCDKDALAKKAEEYARMRLEAMTQADLTGAAEKAQAMMPAEAAAPPAAAAEPEPLPEGWAEAKDANGRSYFWFKATRKTVWQRPTAETPTS